VKEVGGAAPTVQGAAAEPGKTQAAAAAKEG
jgi:hypothetical protein